MMRLIDLFSGIGGFSLGLERTGGFKTVKFCEMKPHAQAVLAKNFPGIPCHEDVTTYDFREGEAEAISAGFPCQDLSFAGDGAGLAGARSGLYREVIRAVRVVRPQIAILENVAALLSRGMGTVLGDLAKIGYDAEWHCIPASAVGAPHRRDRVWIIADPGGEQHESRRPPFSGEIAAELSGTAADADSEQLWEQSIRELECSSPPLIVADGEEGPLANTHDKRELQPQGSECHERGWACNGGEDVENAERFRRNEVVQPISLREDGEGSANSAQHPGFHGGRSWWAVEPDVGRVAHGVPARVDRLAELGNAVVPKVPEIIGRAILRTLAVSSQDRGAQ